MKHLLAPLCAVGVTLVSGIANATYLNIDNMDVAVGDNSTFTSSRNTFAGGRTIDKVIDAPSADASEQHTQQTHLWFTGGTLELVFDFRTEYDLTELHFWNYNGEGFDVDNIDFTFFNAANELQGSLSIEPALGSSPNIFAENILLAAPLDVQFVTAVLTGSNGEIDFQNMGFTGALSSDRCLVNPQDPSCSAMPPGMPPVVAPNPVPEPATIGLLALGLAAVGRMRRRPKH